MKRRRSRRRGEGSSLLPLVAGVGLICFLLVGGAGLKSTAFSTETIPRGTTADVTIDESGAHSLDTTQSVHINSTEPLVDITNNLARDISVTVALRDDSTQLGDLVVDGTTDGDMASFTLRESHTQTVKLTIPDDESLVGQTVYFHVNATATGLDVNAPDRSAPVKG